MIASLYNRLYDDCLHLSIVIVGPKEIEDLFHDCIILVSQDTTNRDEEDLISYFEYKFKMILFQNNQDIKKEYADNKEIAKSKKNI